VRYLALEAAMLRGVAPVDGIQVCGQPAQVLAETLHRVVRRCNVQPVVFVPVDGLQ
jgi:hypothetical protein